MFQNSRHRQKARRETRQAGARTAHAAGLGTVHIGLFDSKQVAQILNVPEKVAVVEMTPLGYPDEQPIAPSRKELSDFVFKGKYGEKYP